MSRSRQSAKSAGASFEAKVTSFLRDALNNPNIERLRTAGANDRGDIGNVRLADGGLVAVECKDYGGQYKVGPWLDEAETEKVNYGAVAAVVVAKRRGTTAPAEQVVLMTLSDFVEIVGVSV